MSICETIIVAAIVTITVLLLDGLAQMYFHDRDE